MSNGGTETGEDAPVRSCAGEGAAGDPGADIRPTFIRKKTVASRAKVSTDGLTRLRRQISASISDDGVGGGSERRRERQAEPEREPAGLGDVSKYQRRQGPRLRGVERIPLGISQYEAWEKERAEAGASSLIFKGNDAAVPKDFSGGLRFGGGDAEGHKFLTEFSGPSPGALARLKSASSFMEAEGGGQAAADAAADPWQALRQTGAAEGAADFVDRDFERSWYDCEDESGLNEYDRWGFGEGGDDPAGGPAADPGVGPSAGPGASRKNVFRASRAEEQELWELGRMAQSGISARELGGGAPALAGAFELPGGATGEDESVVHVIVCEQRPRFLEGLLPPPRAAQQSFSRPGAGPPVAVVKDPTADMAVMAAKGSAMVKHLRTLEDRTKMRQRFWEVGGTQMGLAIGVGAESKTAQEETGEAEAREEGGGATAAPATAAGGPAREPRRTRGAETERGAGSGGKRPRDDSAAPASTAQRPQRRTFAQALGVGVAGAAAASPADSAAAAASTAAQRASLPIFSVRDELLAVLREQQILVVVGETGSGKTTQLTQYFLEAGYGRSGRIGCTQPRRVAAVSVAKRVAEELGAPLPGGPVGYSIRFEDCTGPHTKIQYMTDGILLRESLTDPDLDRYAVIIMDEAHERSLNTDILFGVLRTVLLRRRDLRLVVTSATLNADKFAAFFGNCPIFHIPGRTYPVKIEYLRTVPADYVDAAVQKALQIHCSNAAEAGAAGGTARGGGTSSSPAEKGDILIFMTGQEDIEATCFLIAERASQLGERVPPLTVLPIYSTLPSDLQAKIFEDSAFRKVVVASNIAETSLTLDGVKFVIDSGYCKLKVYNARMGMDSLQMAPISRANAQQRAGRAGRTGPGLCYRLFTERAMAAEMFESTLPEIQRSNLSHTMLLLKSLGVGSVFDFHFMDPPPAETIVQALHQLWVLDALGDDGELTQVGRRMVQFPLDPQMAKLLLVAGDLGCSAEALIVVSMLSVGSVFYRPRDRAEESDAAREKFFVPESDHLTLLSAYNLWRKHGCSPKWAEAHFIHQKAMKRVSEVRQQLLDILSQQRLPLLSCGSAWDCVREAICAGYFHNGAKLRGIGEYVNLRTAAPCYLHGSSALNGAGVTPEYVVYHEVVLTSREFMQHVSAVQPEWLAHWGPRFFQVRATGAATRAAHQQVGRASRRNALNAPGEDVAKDSKPILSLSDRFQKEEVMSA